MTDLEASGFRNPFEDWLPKVIGDAIVFDEGDEGLNAQARGNAWGFSITLGEAKQLKENDVLSFLAEVQNARQTQIEQRFGKSHPMLFYVWFSAQTGELNLSLVSASHGRTGFAGEVEKVSDLREIVKAFLTSPYLEGIPLGEFRVLTQEDIDNYQEPAPSIPRVWVTTLP